MAFQPDSVQRNASHRIAAHPTRGGDIHGQPSQTCSAIDREVVVLRHFEELSNIEAAEVLGIETSAASKRYIRAIRRLKAILDAVPGFFG
jgi:hypothetical protein